MEVAIGGLPLGQGLLTGPDADVQFAEAIGRRHHLRLPYPVAMFDRHAQHLHLDGGPGGVQVLELRSIEWRHRESAIACRDDQAVGRKPLKSFPQRCWTHLVETAQSFDPKPLLRGAYAGDDVAPELSVCRLGERHSGFRPHDAGAIEAIASTGGQFMPPVMRAGVFILATLTETSYLTIALMNVIPALVFFIFLLSMVDLEAVRLGLKGLPGDEIPRLRTVLARGWQFFVPLVTVIWLLFAGYSADYCAFWGTVSAAALSWLRRDTRMGPAAIAQAMAGGAQSNAAAGAAIGTLGIIIGGIVLAGLGLKFSAVLIDLSGGYLFAALCLVTLVSIIIGMGSSTTGSYIILSVVAAPALINLGVPLVAAHLAVFYAACLSNITPPVCVAAFAGAAIAGALPMKTGFSALKFGATLVLMPFSFVYVPQLLLDGSPIDIAYTATLYTLGCLLLAVAIQGTEPVGGAISTARRVLFGLAGALLMFPTTLWLDAAGLILTAVAFAPTLAARRAAAA